MSDVPTRDQPKFVGQSVTIVYLYVRGDSPREEGVRLEASSPPGSPAGSAPASRSRKPLVLIVVAVIVVAGLSIGAYVLLSATSTLSSVELTVTGGTTVDQRQELAITARAIDSRGVDQAGSALFTWSATPAAHRGRP